MSIFDKIRQSDDAFIDELEHNMAIHARTAPAAAEPETEDAPQAGAGSAPTPSLEGKGEEENTREISDMAQDTQEPEGENLSSEETAREVAGRAPELSDALREDAAEIDPDGGLEEVAEIQALADNLDGGARDVKTQAHEALEAADLNQKNAAPAEAGAEGEPEIDVSAAETMESVKTSGNDQEADAAASQADPAEQSADEDLETVAEKAGETQAREGAELILSKIAYRVRLPEKDGAQLVDREDLQQVLAAMPKEVANDLRDQRNRFADQALNAALEHVDPDQTSEADVSELYKAMGSAFFGTKLAQAKLGLKEGSDVRATIEGSPVLDALFQMTLTNFSIEKAAAVTSVDATMAAGTGIDDKLVGSTLGERKQDELDSTSALSQSFVMCGDDEQVSRPEPKKPLSIEEQMEAIGFPKRPKTWPAVMSWPMQPDFDLLVRSKPAPAQVDAYVQSMKEMQARMLQRAEQIDEYIHKNNPVDDRVRWLNRRQSRQHLKDTVDDPHYGIRWASLLDDKSTRPSSAIVREWAHHRATTNDGGIVIAGRDSIGFKKITNQAVALSIQEGVARGWGSFRMQGDHKFTVAAIEAAKQANVKAVITELYGPWNLFKRKHTVMPTPPGVRNAQPRVETENVGLTPDDANARKPLSEEQRRADIADEVTAKMSVDDKRRAIARLANLPGTQTDEPKTEPEFDPIEAQDPFDVIDNPERARTTTASTRVIQEEEEEIRWRNDGNPDADRDMARGPQMA